MSLSRFKGCLMGAAVADCIGALFEGMRVVRLQMVLDEEGKLAKARTIQKESGARPADVYGLSYTDDTAMTRCVAASLIEKDKFCPKDLALRFGLEYKSEPERGYGGNVVTVLEALQKPELEDVFLPASQQFDGSGSYGNGGAMRISPAPLSTFFGNDFDELKRLSDSVTRLTHTHPHAMHGALLQAAAVDLALRLTPGEKLDVNTFIDNLIARLKPVEQSEGGDGEPPRKKLPPKRHLDADPTPYCAKLEKIKELAVDEDLDAEAVEAWLGNDVSALGSVPAAVLCFVRQAVTPEPAIKDRSQFERTVLYAISLGGDTDTIATMAAAIAGAALGEEEIPEAWRYYCEGVAEAEDAAEKLYNKYKNQPAAS